MKSKVLAPAVDFAKIHPHWKQIYLSTLPTFPLEDILAYFKPEDIENYLTQLKQSSRPTTAKAKPKPKKRK